MNRNTSIAQLANVILTGVRSGDGFTEHEARTLSRSESDLHAAAVHLGCQSRYASDDRTFADYEQAIHVLRTICTHRLAGAF